MVKLEKTSGFTLLELLIAMAIFSVISMLMFSGIKQFSKQGSLLLAYDQKFANLQTALSIIETDFLQMTPRSIRDQDGVYVSAMQTSVGGVEFSRGGNAIFAKTHQSSLLRVKYSFDDNKIYRRTWSSMDRTIGDTGMQKVLLEQVDSFNLTFLGKDGWNTAWPEPDSNNNVNSATNTTLPRLVKITINTTDFGEIMRIIPGVGAQKLP